MVVYYSKLKESTPRYLLLWSSVVKRADVSTSWYYNLKNVTIAVFPVNVLSAR